MKLMIFTIRTAGNIYLVNRLIDIFDIVGMVILSNRKKTKRQVLDLWYKRAKQHGLLKALNKLIFFKYEPSTNKVNRTIAMVG